MSTEADMRLSCFPIVPKFACHYLGLPYTGGMKPTTLLGGLTSFGGAGNDYSMHVSALQLYRYLEVPPLILGPRLLWKWFDSSEKERVSMA